MSHVIPHIVNAWYCESHICHTFSHIITLYNMIMCHTIPHIVAHYPAYCQCEILRITRITHILTHDTALSHSITCWNVTQYHTYVTHYPAWCQCEIHESHICHTFSRAYCQYKDTVNYTHVTHYAWRWSICSINIYVCIYVHVYMHECKSHTYVTHYHLVYIYVHAYIHTHICTHICL